VTAALFGSFCPLPRGAVGAGVQRASSWWRRVVHQAAVSCSSTSHSDQQATAAEKAGGTDHQDRLRVARLFTVILELRIVSGRHSLRVVVHVARASSSNRRGRPPIQARVAEGGPLPLAAAEGGSPFGLQSLVPSGEAADVALLGTQLFPPTPSRIPKPASGRRSGSP